MLKGSNTQSFRFSSRQGFFGKTTIARLMIGTALSGIVAASAYAQTNNNQESTETVVVTGTSIRGAAPVGTNLMTVDRAAIEDSGAQTTQQLLSDVPGINTFGGSGQGGSNSDFSGGFAPSIHSIGGGSSSATLVLIDGHRIPTQGLTEAQADPTAIPASALERVEVLPEGASSIYGSDAVAGVINFITRRNFNGLELNAQTGFADQYNTFTGSALFGHSWSGGSVLVAYDYTSQSNLPNSARDFTTARQDIRRGAANPSLFTGIAANPPAGSMTSTPPAGPGTTGPYDIPIPYPSTGTNFQTFYCPVATIAPNSRANAYYYQPGGGYGGPGYSTSTSGVPSQGACGTGPSNGFLPGSLDLLPSVTRHNALIEVRQQVTDSIAFDMQAVYAAREANVAVTRGRIGATVFGPTSANTSQINPFYVGNSATGTDSEYIRYDFQSLLGPGAYRKDDNQNAFVTAGLTWDLGNDREITLSSTVGRSANQEHISGVVSSAEALLALNGTTNSNGTLGVTSQQDIFGLGSVFPGSRVLNANNALDVWNPVSSNQTSQQVIASLKDGGSFSNANHGLEDVVAKFDGPIVDLPAGALKIAVGGEFMHQTMDEYGASSTATGPSRSDAAAYYFREGRTVYSAFLELDAPLVSPDMGVPLVRRFELDVSGRYDRYNDFGDTSNPKVAFNWDLTDGLRARASFGTSFVAPVIHDAQNVNSQSQISAAGTPANPVIPFNTTLPFNGGAGIAGTWVASPSTCAAGHGVVVNQAGQTLAAPYTGAYGCQIRFGSTNSSTQSAALRISGGNGSLKAATGRSYSAGFDVDAGKFTNALDGLTLSATYWETAYHGLITNQQTQNNIPQLTYFAPPGGWSPQDPYIQAFVRNHPISIALPSEIFATFDGRLQNAYNLWENGIDFSANYMLRTDNSGIFRFGIDGTELLRYSQQGGNTGPILDTKDGKNHPRYNSQDLTFRAKVGWSGDGISTLLAMNYIHPYGLYVSNFPYNLPGPGRGFLDGYPAAYKSAGTAHVGAVITFDLSANYAIPRGLFGMSDAVTSGTSLSLIVKNILDTDPPFTDAGYQGFTIGNPIGRLITVGLRKDF